MSKKLLRTEQRMDRKDAAEKLHNLADKLGEGSIELKAGDNSVTLQPANDLEFELDVEKESDGDMSLEIELEWSETTEENSVEIK